ADRVAPRRPGLASGRHRGPARRDRALRREVLMRRGEGVDRVRARGEGQAPRAPAFPRLPQTRGATGPAAAVAARGRALCLGNRARARFAAAVLCARALAPAFLAAVSALAAAALQPAAPGLVAREGGALGDRFARPTLVPSPADNLPSAAKIALGLRLFQ